MNPSKPSRLVLIASLTLGLCACRGRTREAAEVVAGLDQEVERLSRENHALRVENASLRSQLLGPTWQEMIQLDQAGSVDTGFPYRRICPQGQPLIGLRGRSGALIDALVPVCGPLESPEAPEGVATQRYGIELDPFGGLAGGAPFEQVCAGDDVVVGLHGRAGAFIDGVSVLCGQAREPEGPAQAQGSEDTSGESAEGSGEGEPTLRPHRGSNLRPAQRAEGEWTELSHAGGYGGNEFLHVCPRGWAAVGLSGRQGRYVEGIVLHCANLSR
jgi:hypothetical protein